MRLSRNISTLALGVLLLHRASAASDSCTNTNPYLAITVHNSFGLQPPSPPPSASDAVPPPQKITLTGIMSIFGRNFALLKTDSGKNEKNLLLAEGRSDGDIELVSVNAEAGTVEIKNNGVVETIKLPKTPTLTYKPAAVAGGPDTAAGNPASGYPANNTLPVGTTVENAGSSSAQSLPVALAIGGIGSSSSTGNNSSSNNSGNPGNSGSSDSSGAGDGSSQSVQSSDGSSSTGATKQPEAWWKIGSRNLEASRIATASLVMNGKAEPYPLTPYTPAGTPAALIGPGTLYFVPDAMKN
jgi:hypothetical protein